MGARLAAVAAVGVVLAFAAPGRGAVSGAAGVIDGLDASLLDVLKQADALGYQGRLAKLQQILDGAYDMEFMAEKCLGTHAKTLTPAERAQWTASFRTLMAANWAARFDAYEGQTFTRIDEEPGANDTVVVRTKVTSPKEEVQLSYRLRETPAGWQIIDLYLNGTVSELALRRSEYASVLERDGFAALITTVDAKIADLAAGKVKR